MSLLKKYVEIPINKLVLADWNYKKIGEDDKDTEELMEKLKANLAKNDQIENLIIREAKAKGYFEVVNGNHRLLALKDLKKKKAICFNLGKITQAHAERIAIETNETKFEKDPMKFAGLIEKLAIEFDIDELVSTMPMTSKEVESYAKLLNFDWSQFDSVDDPDNSGEGSDGTLDDGEWVEYEFKLPVDLANLFQFQINRIKEILYPKKDTGDVSIVPVIECMTSCIADMPDEIILGE